jgi:hypothetical protein
MPLQVDRTTPPADVDMTVLLIDPKAYSKYQPYGNPYFAGDGSVIYTGVGSVTLVINALTFDKDTQGNAASTGTVKKLFADWRLCREQYSQQVWINRYNPETAGWIKQLAVWHWMDWSNKRSGAAYLGLELSFVALGINTSSYTGGEVLPPADDGSQMAVLDMYRNGWGVGGWGVGGWGESG